MWEENSGKRRHTHTTHQPARAINPAIKQASQQPAQHTGAKQLS